MTNRLCHVWEGMPVRVATSVIDGNLHPLVPSDTVTSRVDYRVKDLVFNAWRRVIAWTMCVLVRPG